MKKTIQWYEKRGKGSYFDPKLRHFIDEHFQFSDISDQITDKDIINPDNMIDPTTQEGPKEQNPTCGWWIPVPDKILKKLTPDMKFTEEDLKPLNRIMFKKEAIKIWEEIIEKRKRNDTQRVF